MTLFSRDFLFICGSFSSAHIWISSKQIIISSLMHNCHLLLILKSFYSCGQVFFAYKIIQLFYLFWLSPSFSVPFVITQYAFAFILYIVFDDLLSLLWVYLDIVLFFLSHLIWPICAVFSLYFFSFSCILYVLFSVFFFSCLHLDKQYNSDQQSTSNITTTVFLRKQRYTIVTK